MLFLMIKPHALHVKMNWFGEYVHAYNSLPTDITVSILNAKIQLTVF